MTKSNSCGSEQNVSFEEEKPFTLQKASNFKEFHLIYHQKLAPMVWVCAWVVLCMSLNLIVDTKKCSNEHFIEEKPHIHTKLLH